MIKKKSEGREVNINEQEWRQKTGKEKTKDN